MQYSISSATSVALRETQRANAYLKQIKQEDLVRQQREEREGSAREEEVPQRGVGDRVRGVGVRRTEDVEDRLGRGVRSERQRRLRPRRERRLGRWRSLDERQAFRA